MCSIRTEEILRIFTVQGKDCSNKRMFNLDNKLYLDIQMYLDRYGPLVKGDVLARLEDLLMGEKQ